MITNAENVWKIDSEWTLESSHFKYHYVLSKDYEGRPGKRKIKKDFVDYMTEMYGTPDSRWGFRFDNNFDTISVYFSNQEDAVIFRLTHG